VVAGADVTTRSADRVYPADLHRDCWPRSWPVAIVTSRSGVPRAPHRRSAL